jgi:hypothetical protein
MVKRAKKYALCVAKDGCDDLVVSKLYRIIRDDRAAREGFLRVIDDSGDDYLYPAKQFVLIDLPAGASRKLAGATRR